MEIRYSSERDICVSGNYQTSEKGALAYKYIFLRMGSYFDSSFFHPPAVRNTPGHTEGCACFVADDESFVLTGDALLIQGKPSIEDL